MTLSRGKGRRGGGHHPEGEEGKGTPGGEGIGEGSYVPRCCTQQFAGESLGHGASKGSMDLGSLQPQSCSYLWLKLLGTVSQGL